MLSFVVVVVEMAWKMRLLTHVLGWVDPPPQSNTRKAKEGVKLQKIKWTVMRLNWLVFLFWFICVIYSVCLNIKQLKQRCLIPRLSSVVAVARWCPRHAHPSYIFHIAKKVSCSVLSTYQESEEAVSTVCTGYRIQIEFEEQFTSGKTLGLSPSVDSDF